MSDLQIFTYLLTRIGGSTFDSLEKLNSKRLFRSIHKIIKFDEVYKTQKNALSEELLQFIKSVNNDKNLQNRVLNLRRDIYNDRYTSLDNQIVDDIGLSKSLEDNLKHHLNRIDEKFALIERFDKIYHQELLNSRTILKKMASDDTLQKGLILSSNGFQDRLNNLKKSKIADYTKKEYSLELTLLKYITRIKAKTSPFSTFNNLVLGVLCSQKELVTIDQNKNDIKCYVALNSYIFKYLKNIFFSSRNIYKYFLVRGNPTIHRDGNNYVYLTNFNNIESFQRLPITPVLLLIEEKLNQARSGIQFQKLIYELKGDINAKEDEINEYIKQLINYGFLEFDLEVSGIDAKWDIKLINKLYPLQRDNVPHIKE